jgi:hypothetical protein
MEFVSGSKRSGFRNYNIHTRKRRRRSKIRVRRGRKEITRMRDRLFPFRDMKHLKIFCRNGLG